VRLIDEREQRMRDLVISVPFAVAVSVILVVLGAVLASSPATRGLWISNVVAAAALFAAIVYAGTALRRHRNRHD
jgi:uncharacterized membrane protein HdeD (DUF308 family)